MYHLLFASCCPKGAGSQTEETGKQEVTFVYTKTGLVQPLTEAAKKRAEEIAKKAEK